MLHALARRLPATRASLFDLLIACGILAGGLAYHWDLRYWTLCAIEDVPIGDAMFWWYGGVHVAEGNFTDHPCLHDPAFRPGYFLLTGLALPALGGDLLRHHKFLLAQFLAAAVLLYLALRRPIGRPAAACGVALLVFNPYSAEWLATTTSDATGLVLHLVALACLLVGVRSALRWGWLAGFGFLFALGTVTRPLVTPFVAVATAAVLLAAASWRRRLLGVAVVVAAFCGPTVGWMAVQRVLVGEWSISTSGPSTFYAASDPAIQEWNPAMYEPVLASARQRYGGAGLTARQVNRELWRLTLRNYRKHYRYHLQRFLPQLWQVARFSPQTSSHFSRHGSQSRETTWLFALGVALALGVLRRAPLRSLVVLAVAGCLYLSPDTLGFFTCGGALLALLLCPGQQRNLGLFLLAGYWLTGVLALILTGGLGSPAWPVPALNALGYRIGSQFYFAGNLLAASFLHQLATLNLEPPADAVAPPPGGLLGRLVRDFFLRPAPVAAAVLLALAGLAVVADMTVAAVGVVAISRRCYVRERGRKTPFPDRRRSWQCTSAGWRPCRPRRWPTRPPGPCGWCAPISCCSARAGPRWPWSWRAAAASFCGTCPARRVR
jgi:hypothetical protein